MSEGNRQVAAHLAMFAILLAAVGVSYVVPDRERINEHAQPLEFVLVGGWVAVVLWTVDYRRTPAFILLMLSSAGGIALTLWSLGFLAAREAVAVGVLAAGLGVFAPRLR